MIRVTNSLATAQYQLIRVEDLLVKSSNSEKHVAFIGRKSGADSWELWICTGNCIFPAERPWNYIANSIYNMQLWKWVDVDMVCKLQE